MLFLGSLKTPEDALFVGEQSVEFRLHNLTFNTDFFTYKDRQNHVIKSLKANFSYDTEKLWKLQNHQITLGETVDQWALHVVTVSLEQILKHQILKQAVYKLSRILAKICSSKSRVYLVVQEGII